jgi:hypothetical protein
VYVDVVVQAEWQFRTDYVAGLAGRRSAEHGLLSHTAGNASNGGRYGQLTLADADAARERAGIVVDPVVGDLQVMRPAVGEYAATALTLVAFRSIISVSFANSIHY